MPNKNVFISYARADALELSQKLYRWLSDELRALPFWDKEDLKPGDDWKYEIDTAIEECAFLLLILTPGALKSQHVTYEWAYAMGQGKLIIPLQADVRITEKKLHPKLAELQYIPFINPTQEDWDSLKGKLEHRLSETHVPPEVVAAVEMLNSPIFANRQEAIRSLEQMEIPSADKALKNAINHNQPHVRVLAGIAYARRTKCQDMNAIPGLAQALGGELNNDFYDAIKLLVQMNNEEAANCLFNGLEQVKDQTSKNTTLIEQGLIRLTDKSVIPVLKKALGLDVGFRVSLIQRLAQFYDTEILPILIEIIRNERDFKRQNKLINLLGQYPHSEEKINAAWDLMIHSQSKKVDVSFPTFQHALSILSSTKSEIVLQRLQKGVNDGLFHVVYVETVKKTILIMERN